MKSLKLDWTGVSFMTKVMEFGHRVLCNSIIVFVDGAYDMLSLQGKVNVSGNEFSRYNETFYGGAGQKYSLLLDEVRFIARVATLMLSLPPFTNDAVLEVKDR